MADEYIRKQDAVDVFNRAVKDVGILDADDIKTVFRMLSPADVAPVRHGTWLPIVSYNNTYKCSECGRLLVDITDGLNMVAKHYPYCHCGAKMDGEE